jgi:hypothetical protein
VHFVDAAAMASSLIAARSEFLGGDAFVGNMEYGSGSCWHHIKLISMKICALQRLTGFFIFSDKQPSSVLSDFKSNLCNVMRDSHSLTISS